MQGWAPEDSMALANMLSSWVVRHVSATPPLPDEVLSEIRALQLRASMTTLS
jgi:sugar/nucleoside kinase (ribokinase family)